MKFLVDQMISEVPSNLRCAMKYKVCTGAGTIQAVVSLSWRILFWSYILMHFSVLWSVSNAVQITLQVVLNSIKYLKSANLMCNLNYEQWF